MKKLIVALLVCQAGSLQAYSMENCCSFNPSSRFQSERCGNFFAEGEFLYWIAQERGLAYVQTGKGGTAFQPTGTQALINAGNFDFDGDMARVHAKWDPGFRVGIGYNTPYDDWILFASWTRYHTHSKDAHDLSTSFGGPTWGIVDQNEAEPLNFASAKWRFHLDTVDLRIGRSFWIGNCFALQPYVGLIMADIDQQILIDYFVQFTKANRTSSMHLDVKSDFTGGGLEVGLDPRFSFPAGFSLLSKAGGSVLYGRFHNKFLEYANDVFLIAESPDHYTNAVANLQLALGIGWDYTFECGPHFGIHALWEENFWFGVNQMDHWLSQLHKSYVNEQQYAMILQGLTASARFDF